ncbi:4-amino-4-deoxychorismate lyase [Mycobacterium intermedium]|uniref:aminodeoxychorismate lyase n=1 Tax=Mycobacterium intermedium TaxID=28445 RepID=A0A1E3SDL5_MYCIE|nr:aminodeoxychorismate lyase [Mycobacterium intermedium]MCV6964016.1 aminodeoxychorismate lyase [Mycobacterium intermedium]ODR00175.1 4-amino-4-deoxychorismate lyase [Mycobacterium intermedium]OPE44830.1 4-amino-4-deoxychorismate lyase [Mycobacterium intermedium]ORB07889.1 4-amino-4-deoxychorismate lyase [Mycobacterium intermedium]
MGVVVTLDGEILKPDTPLLYADDLAAVRGDGVFETLLVRDGRACLIESHLQRLTQSAKLMDLPAPVLADWRNAIDVATQQWVAGTADEGAMRLIYSRGRESAPAPAPTGYVMINPVPDRVTTVRRDGISAITLDRGLPAKGADQMPWLLAGAKTLSYAVNMAALRHAARQGADDVIFVSADGYILEGPRSTVVIAADGEGSVPSLLTPPPWYPILRGTTQQALFEVARAEGYDCDYRALRVADLEAAHGIWLISSMTLAARVHTLNGRRLPHAPIAGAFAELVDSAIVIDR